MRENIYYRLSLKSSIEKYKTEKWKENKMQTCQRQWLCLRTTKCRLMTKNVVCRPEEVPFKFSIEIFAKVIPKKKKIFTSSRKFWNKQNQNHRSKFNFCGEFRYEHFIFANNCVGFSIYAWIFDANNAINFFFIYMIWTCLYLKCRIISNDLNMKICINFWLRIINQPCKVNKCRFGCIFFKKFGSFFNLSSILIQLCPPVQWKLL